MTDSSDSNVANYVDRSTSPIHEERTSRLMSLCHMDSSHSTASDTMNDHLWCMTERELRFALVRERIKTAILQKKYEELKTHTGEISVKAEEEEDCLANRFFRRLVDQKKEKESLIIRFEEEEELLTNTLQRKLQSVIQEKANIENQLEAEQEYIVNRLTKQLSEARSEKSELEKALAARSASSERMTSQLHDNGLLSNCALSASTCMPSTSSCTSATSGSSSPAFGMTPGNRISSHGATAAQGLGSTSAAPCNVPGPLPHLSVAMNLPSQPMPDGQQPYTGLSHSVFMAPGTSRCGKSRRTREGSEVADQQTECHVNNMSVTLHDLTKSMNAAEIRHINERLDGLRMVEYMLDKWREVNNLNLPVHKTDYSQFYSRVRSFEKSRRGLPENSMFRRSASDSEIDIFYNYDCSKVKEINCGEGVWGSAELQTSKDCEAAHSNASQAANSELSATVNPSEIVPSTCGLNKCSSVRRGAAAAIAGSTDKRITPSDFVNASNAAAGSTDHITTSRTTDTAVNNLSERLLTEYTALWGEDHKTQRVFEEYSDVGKQLQSSATANSSLSHYPSANIYHHEITTASLDESTAPEAPTLPQPSAIVPQFPSCTEIDSVNVFALTDMEVRAFLIGDAGIAAKFPQIESEAQRHRNPLKRVDEDPRNLRKLRSLTKRTQRRDRDLLNYNISTNEFFMLAGHGPREPLLIESLLRVLYTFIERRRKKLQKEKEYHLLKSSAREQILLKGSHLFTQFMDKEVPNHMALVPMTRQCAASQTCNTPPPHFSGFGLGGSYACDISSSGASTPHSIPSRMKKSSSFKELYPMREELDVFAEASEGEDLIEPKQYPTDG